MSLVAAADALVALVVPPRCAVCGEGCAPAEPLCAACDRRLRRLRPILEPGPAGVESVAAAGEFDGVLRELVLAIKLGRRVRLARRAAAAILAAAPAPSAASIVVPVPPRATRRRWRGFDAAEELALSVADLAGLGYRDCLSRHDSRPQVGRSRAQRLGDPPRVRARRPAPPSALLVDDVHTTGATLGACAEALRSAGAERISCLTLARAL